jgi:hypothetical protein
MKHLILAALLFSTSAFAADTWSTGDTYREATFQVLNIIDWGQTRYIAQHPDQFYESESAWIIGKHPSVETVDTFMLVSAILHPLVAYYLPSSWRSAFQYISIGGKLNNTIGNASIGIKVSF